MSDFGAPLPRSFYAGDSRRVARALLNKVLVRGERAARIVEVEAYRGTGDPASHAFRGPSPRNAVMFGPPGHLYVYFTYGMHWCANAVCGEEGWAEAVLLRAAAPLAGLDAMRRARGPAVRADRDLCSGPAKLAQAFGLSRADDGANLVTADRGVAICDDGVAPPRRPRSSSRVGIRVAVDEQWRWFVDGDPNVSRAR